MKHTRGQSPFFPRLLSEKVRPNSSWYGDGHKSHPPIKHLAGPKLRLATTSKLTIDMYNIEIPHPLFPTARTPLPAECDMSIV